MSPGATTHGNDMNQRHLELSVTPTAGGLSAVAPANANLAPPGNYMPFTLTADGVPSEARWAAGRRRPSAPPPNSPPTAAFTFLPASPQTGQSVTFTDGSTDSDGTIASRGWDTDNDGAFDDGTGASASRTFTAPGTYTSLQVTDDDEPATTTCQVTSPTARPRPRRPRRRATWSPTPPSRSTRSAGAATRAR